MRVAAAAAAGGEDREDAALWGHSAEPSRSVSAPNGQEPGEAWIFPAVLE